MVQKIQRTRFSRFPYKNNLSTVLRRILVQFSGPKVLNLQSAYSAPKWLRVFHAYSSPCNCEAATAPELSQYGTPELFPGSWVGAESRKRSRPHKLPLEYEDKSFKSWRLQQFRNNITFLYIKTSSDEISPIFSLHFSGFFFVHAPILIFVHIFIFFFYF